MSLHHPYATTSQRQPLTNGSLTVDVYVPFNAKEDSKLPVKVWAYGGFNAAGGTADPLYDACNLATDAVVVEFNYRLGPMGFLALESAGIGGNMAIQDGLATLEWVQDNIAQFGGDKDHVVMFGQSAGGNDVYTISSLPQAPKLLKGVVVQSGGGTFVTPHKVAQDAGAQLAKALKCTSSSKREQVRLTLHSIQTTRQSIKADCNLSPVVLSSISSCWNAGLGIRQSVFRRRRCERHSDPF